MSFGANNIKTVVIDPGHGGEDGGAVSDSGVLEKDVNLGVSIKLEHLLSLFGINTEMTRYNDTSLGLDMSELIRNRKVQDIRKRVEIIESIPNAMLVSIHQNSFPQEMCKGAQVFYSTRNGMSKVFADALQEDLKNVLDKNNKRTSKPTDSSIYILNNVSCPAVLVECGFLTNPTEESLLKTEEYQKKLALSVAGTIYKNLR